MREITPDGFGKRIRLEDKEKGITRREEMQTQKQLWVNTAAHHMERAAPWAWAITFSIGLKTSWAVLVMMPPIFEASDTALS